jgi:hypothetical protein
MFALRSANYAGMSVKNIVKWNIARNVQKHAAAVKRRAGIMLKQ